MTIVTFSLRAGLGRESEADVLARLARLAGVRRVARIKPDARQDFSRRMCYLEVANEQAVDVLDRLHRESHIEDASVPPERHLV